MKYLVGTLLFLGVMVGGAWVLSAQGTNTALSAALSQAQVTVLADGVLVAGKPVAASTVIADGEIVSTNATGRAIVQNDLRIITSLDANTSIQYGEVENAGTLIEVEAGRIWSRVERTLEQDEVYEVYTPTMVAAVRGTSFGAVVSEDRERLVVGEGMVATYERDPETGEAERSTELLVQAGEAVEIINGERVIRPVLQQDEDDWYVEHMDDAWEHGGSETLEVTTAHREGLMSGAFGKVTIVGRGFNMIESVVVDGAPLRLQRLSDRELLVPVSDVVSARGSQNITVVYDRGTEAMGYEIFTGSYEEVRANLGL